MFIASACVSHHGPPKESEKRCLLGDGESLVFPSESPLLFQASCTQFEVPTASWRFLFGENFESLTLKLIMDIIYYIYTHTYIYPSIFLEILISIPIISHLDLSYTSLGIYILGQSSIPSHLSLWVNPSIYIYPILSIKGFIDNPITLSQCNSSTLPQVGVWKITFHYKT
jgi:hypothetical protein